MAPNFRIAVHRNSQSLHLKLLGDFDGSSAHQLLNVLKSDANGLARVFVHTDCLRNVHPFGQDVFQNNLDILKRQTVPLVFTGEYASQLAPGNNALVSILP
ncbi:MAG: hypothetical protein JRD04_01070 [Deltaproteobacteria bacterium]|nr:hypothetical protein [Deltaproteobacteria bacterium]